MPDITRELCCVNAPSSSPVKLATFFLSLYDEESKKLNFCTTVHVDLNIFFIESLRTDGFKMVKQVCYSGQTNNFLPNWVLYRQIPTDLRKCYPKPEKIHPRKSSPWKNTLLGKFPFSENFPPTIILFTNLIQVNEASDQDGDVFR